MTDTKPVEDTSHLTFTQAGEYYVHAFQTGRDAGVLSERTRIVNQLLDPDFQDEINWAWKDDTTIYEAIVQVLKNRANGN